MFQLAPNDLIKTSNVHICPQEDWTSPKVQQVARESHGKDAKVHGQDGVDLSSPLQGRLPAQEPHRASSFEPREGEDNSQRRRKSSKTDAPTRSSELDRAEGRVDLEEPLFENPGFEYDQRSTRTSLRDGPLQLRASQLHQGQGSHTHFNEEEEEEEEPQARSSEPNPVEWSAPDGRLPSPDHDLASQFFGGH
ncbi:unnamed protein product [Microthlaspi erraticum]|uniref:Uncharacterized protein n=1 Tax=Microthlaspi erraticum TaxID=1685480 RepID=A0A6D2JP77_9BRAS|nr:unnamed protein product [Microthlaspi erraticum]